MGRPRKDDEESANNVETKIVNKLTHKVVSYTDYLTEAREQILQDGGEDVYNRAIEILYTRNQVIATVQKAGETRFVCKV